MIGLQPQDYGTHSLRRTKASIVDKATGNLRAVQILLGHAKIESTVRYLGVDVEDALELAERTEVQVATTQYWTFRGAGPPSRSGHWFVSVVLIAPNVPAPANTRSVALAPPPQRPQDSEDGSLVVPFRSSRSTMTQVPQRPLIQDNTFLARTLEDGRALAIMLARNSIHAMQGELETLKTGRPQYAHDPYGLIAASHVIAVEFATIAAANDFLAAADATTMSCARADETLDC